MTKLTYYLSLFSVSLFSALAVLDLSGCSAYRSKDREGFSTQGPPQVRGAQKPTDLTALKLGAQLSESCSGWPAAANVQRALVDEPVHFSMYQDATSDTPTCRMRVATTDLYDCRKVSFAAEAFELWLSHQSHVTSRFSQNMRLAAIAFEVSGRQLVNFYAFKPGQAEIIYCQSESSSLKVQEQGLVVVNSLVEQD